MKKLLLFLLALPLICWGQEITVVGVITDGNETLPGAYVLEKDTQKGVISDFNGNFEITVSSPETVLVFTFIGFETQEINIAGKNRIDVTLIEAAQSLDQVTVLGFEGVIGKSRKRTESIQKVPESVTALNSKGISSMGVNNLGSFTKLVPNLKLNTSQAAGINFITVRGIPQIRNADAPVAFVIDGVTVPDPSLLNQELFDLALIEVVKGPQGALYGKNAIGGAINIYSKEPVNKFRNSLKVGYGNGNNLMGQFISSGGIVKDKLYYRFSSQYKSFDGLLTNKELNKKVDYSKDLNLRGQLIADISNNLKLTGFIQYLNTKSGAAYYSVHPTGNVYVPNEPGGPLHPDPQEGNNIIAGDEFGDSQFSNIFGGINLETGFGKVKFQSITSYNYVDRSLSGDLDFTPSHDFTQGEKAKTKTINQEFRFRNANTSSKINWSAGGFFQNITKPFFQDGLSRDFDLDEVFPVIAADVVNTTRTIALFGFADYKITNKLTFSAGFRFDNDKFTQDDKLFTVSSSRTNYIFQPKASISLQATDAVLLYTNYGRGYRTGGYNPAITDKFNRDFKDELTDNFELGVKTSFWNNRVIINGSGFLTYFKNQQQYIFDLDTYYAGNYNYERSRIVGFEVDTKVRLFKYLDLLFNYGYVNSKITKGGTTGGTDGKTTDLNSYNGKFTPFIPVNNFNVGLQSNIEFSDETALNIYINLNNTGKTYWDELNNPDFTTSAYKLLDAQISVTIKKFTITLWGKNMLNKQYYMEYVPSSLFGATDDIGWRGRPATFGTTVGFSF